ncbi:hypothetical protein MHYP_G00205760 [Metynnis hypsauchen]
MVCSRVLVGLVLLSVLSSAVKTLKMPIWPETDVHERPADKALQNLPQIISFLDRNYLDNDQFTIAINIPAEKCSSHIKPVQNFLPDVAAWKVKHAMNSPARVYRGQRLIAAKQKTINETISYHPEYLLLIQSNPPENTFYDPLLKELLDSDKHGCVVFYTYKSPCVKSCSAPEGTYSILPALDMLSNHKGPKAFVFRKVWEPYVDPSQKKEDVLLVCFPSGGGGYSMWGYWQYFPQHEANIKAVNAKVPLYHCDKNRCYHCVYRNSEVVESCMISYKWSV